MDATQGWRCSPTARPGGAVGAGVVVGGLVALVLTAAAAWAAGPEPTGSTGPSDTGALGVLEPVARTVLGAPTSGAIVEVLVEEGQQVSKGQVLVQLDDRGRRLEYERARLAAEDRSGVEQARLTAQYRRQEYERQKRAFEAAPNPTISKSELETYRLNSELARVSLQMRLAESALRQKVVEIRRYELENTRIRAPFSGLITRKLAEVGQVAEVGTPLLELIDTRRLYLVTHLPASQLKEVSVGQEALVTPELSPELARRGRVVVVGPEVVADTVRVKVLLDNPEGRLRPGLFARVALLGPEPGGGPAPGEPPSPAGVRE